MADSGCPFAHNPYPAGSPVAGKAGTFPDSKDGKGGEKRAREEQPSILGFTTSEKGFLQGDRPGPTHYGSYLGIPALLNNQDGDAECKPGGKGIMHHEELTFIIVHQVFELWFKLTTSDLVISRDLLKDICKVEADVVFQRMDKVGGYLRRCEGIFTHLAAGFGLIETMHPADFIEFRDYLIPASGFQSVQFRSLEQLFGVQRLARSKVHGREVFTYLTNGEQDQLATEAREPSINEILEEMLSQVVVPDNFKEVYYATTEKVLREQQFDIAKAAKGDPAAEKHVKTGVENMRSTLEDPLEWSEGLFCSSEAEMKRYKDAVCAALFITSYRAEPRYALLASFLDQLIAVEQSMLLWRGRHMHMAERMIGRRAGTGGTGSGVGYLDVTRRYRVFHCLWLVRKLFVRASALPPLSTFDIPVHMFKRQ